MQAIESGALRAPLSIFLYFPHVNRLIKKIQFLPHATGTGKTKWRNNWHDFFRAYNLTVSTI